MTKYVGYRAGMPFSPEILRQVEEGGFDIIHSHCPITSTMLARVLRERIDVPVVFTYHTKFDIDIANAVRGKLFAGGGRAHTCGEHLRLRRGVDGQQRCG